MQCPTCNRRVKRNKNGTFPKHYIEDFPIFGWAQKECPAVGSTDGRGWSNPANSSTMICPCCSTRVSKKGDGRMRAHPGANGRECSASFANR